MLWALGFFCKVKYKIEGRANARLNPKMQYIVVSKHQSTWETLFFTTYFHCPAFILKRELLYIPLFGIYLKCAGMIVIDRNKGVKAIMTIMQKVKNLKGKERPIVIFPEGSRVTPGTIKHFHKGVMAIIRSSPNGIIIPVALNSGLYWPKGGRIKTGSTIVVKFLPQIRVDQFKGELMEHLENSINSESEKLLRHDKPTSITREVCRT